VYPSGDVRTPLGCIAAATAHARGNPLQLSILLLSTDRVAADALTATLSGPGHGVTVLADPAQLAAAAAGHSLVIIDQLPPPATTGSVIGELRSNEATHEIPILAIAQADDVEERIRLLELGADDVITKPFDQAELEARIEALSLRAQRSHVAGHGAPNTIGDRGGRRSVVVFSPKGGVGTTTIATNLAVLAAERKPGGTLLIDLDLTFGQVASHLNIQPKQTLVELVRDEAALRDAELFRTYTVHHSSGIQVLAAPTTPGFASLVSAEQLETIMTLASEAYEIVIVDAGALADDRMLAVFSRADTVVVPVLPEIPALNAVRLLIEQLSETGSMGASTLFVLNNAFARELLRRGDVESALGASISADLPYDPISYLKAVNEGNPVVRGAPRSQAASGLRELATVVLGPVPQPTAGSVSQAPRERRGLFGLRR
jgi:pilus assembly protein CpaE